MMDRWISTFLLGGVIASVASIAVSDSLFGIACLLWAVDCWNRREIRLEVPRFFPIVLIFFLTVLLAIVFSNDPASSAGYLKKFIKFLYIVLIFTYVRREQIEPAFKGLFALLGLSAFYGILQYFWLMDVNLVNRIDGFMSHWMTFSGQLMMGSLALASYVCFYRIPRLSNRREGVTGSCASVEVDARYGIKTVFWAVLLILFLFVLILTQTRNAWLGLVGGMFLLLWKYRRFWVLVGAVSLLALFILLPSEFQNRLYSAFDPNDTTTRIRLELLYTGKNIILAHPWLGLGPQMVPRFYEAYNETDEFPSWIYQHLHNDFIHIAAEMGLMALAVWMAWWIGVIRDFHRMVQEAGSDRLKSSAALAGLAVVVGFLLAGLFEYNFGDSEILVLLLFFITIPYVIDTSTKKIP